MNRHRYRVWTPLLLGLALVALAAPAVAQDYPTHLDLQMGPQKADIPPDGSYWHELVPTFCRLHEQTAYADNGDGVISICDWMNLKDPDTGAIFGYHIEWVGPTFWVDYNGDGVWDPDNDVIYEPTEYDEFAFDTLPEFCDMWDMIYPYMEPWHVTGYEDNGDGVPSFCDWVWFDTFGLHIVDVTVNVRVGPPGPPVAVETSTWGRIKQMYDE
jgi:hypothetical protein